MKIKQLLLPVIALCMTVATTNAAVIFSVTDNVPMDPPGTPNNRSTTTTLGTVGTLTQVLPNLSYTINGLNLTSVGGGTNISITFQMAFTQTGGTGVTNTAFGNVSVGTNLIAGSEVLTLTPTITSETSPLDMSNFTIAINQVSLGDYGNGDFTSIVHAGGTINKQRTVTTDGVATFANSSFARIDDVSSSDGTTLQSFRVEITVVPEPSTALLGGLGMLCLLRRRRA